MFLPDALPGRVQTIELWPFSQGEIDHAPDGFVDAVFEHGPSLRHSTTLGRADYAERLVRGGFPEVLTLPRPASRRRYFNAYIEDLIEREITEIGEIERLPELHTVLRLLAARAGSLLVMDPIASDARLAAVTARRYVSLLEQVFMVNRLPAWSRNVSVRATGTPKIFFVDSGVAAHLLNQTSQTLLEPTNNAFGPLLESFVVSDISRQLSWNDEPIDLSHYRTRDKVEVGPRPGTSAPRRRRCRGQGGGHRPAGRLPRPQTSRGAGRRRLRRRDRALLGTANTVLRPKPARDAHERALGAPALTP